MSQSSPKLNIKEIAVESTTSTTAVVGADPLSSNNVKLRRGGVGQLEVVTGDDATTDGLKSANKVQINAKNVLLGTNTTSVNNVKLHRSGTGEIGFVLGDDVTTEGNRSTSNALIQAKSLVLGDSPNQSQNIKIRRSDSGRAEIVTADDLTTDGQRSVKRATLDVKDLSIGNVAIDPSKNVKLHRSGDGEIQFVKGDDNTLDGFASSTLAKVKGVFEASDVVNYSSSTSFVSSAKSASVVNSMSGSETDQAPSVASVKSFVTPVTQILSGTNVDWSLYGPFYKELSSSSTFTFSNTTEAGTIVILLKNTSAAPITVTMPVSVSNPSLTMTDIPAGSYAVFTFMYVNAILFKTVITGMI